MKILFTVIFLVSFRFSEINAAFRNEGKQIKLEMSFSMKFCQNMFRSLCIHGCMEIISRPLYTVANSCEHFPEFSIIHL